jgi:hypothetical protein
MNNATGMLGKWTALSKSFPNALLNLPVVNIVTNFAGKPGLTCLKIKVEEKKTEDALLSHENARNHMDYLYLTAWTGSGVHVANTVADCIPHLNVAVEKQSVNKNLVAVLICQSGRFAGSVFQCRKISEKELAQMKKNTIADSLVHKTFHKYTVRKKQGKAQSNFDRSGGGMSTAGSQIRRNNEKLFEEELTGLLCNDWKQYLESCSNIFIHAPGTRNYKKFIDLLPKNVPVITIPFRVLNPTYQQVLIAFKRLMTVHVFKEDEMQAIQSDVEKEEAQNSGAILLPITSEDTETKDSDIYDKHRTDYDYYKVLDHNTPTPGIISPKSLLSPLRTLSPILFSPISLLSPLSPIAYSVFPDKISEKEKLVPSDQNSNSTLGIRYLKAEIMVSTIVIAIGILTYWWI